MSPSTSPTFSSQLPHGLGGAAVTYPASRDATFATGSRSLNTTPEPMFLAEGAIRYTIPEPGVRTSGSTNTTTIAATVTSTDHGTNCSNDGATNFTTTSFTTVSELLRCSATRPFSDSFPQPNTTPPAPTTRAQPPSRSCHRDWTEATIPALEVRQTSGETTGARKNNGALLQVETEVLSDEMLLASVLRWLDPQQLAKMRLVCHSWCRTADRNVLWRPFCSKRWPSSTTPQLERAIMQMGGYAVYYRKSVPRIRSRLRDFLFSLDIVARSQEGGVPVERAIAGLAVPGADASFAPIFQPEDDEGWQDHSNKCPSAVLTAKLNEPWRVEVKPYVYQSLSDIANGRKLPNPVPHELEIMPELRIKSSVLHQPSMQVGHLVTAHEGLSLRSRKYYEKQAAAAGSLDALEALSAGGKEWLGFSGQLHLPPHVNNGLEHTVDIFLIGDKKIESGKPTMYTFSEIRIGPLFAHGAIQQEPTGGEADFLDMLDLKLGLFKQQQATELGSNSL